MQSMRRFFFAIEGPTSLVAIALYTSWALLVWFHAHLPWWVLAPVGGYVVAWHFSLQHECIHSLRTAPAWLRWAVAMPPLGLWLPFPLYYHSHRQHHQNTPLTEPGVDTESVYMRNREWADTQRWFKSILRANMTLAGRVTIGPVLRLVRLVQREFGMIVRGDTAHVKHWLVHALLVSLVLGFVVGIAKMPLWQYLVLFFWPAFMYGWVRPFVENCYGPPARTGRNGTDGPLAHARPGERVAVIESNQFWGLLFLYNNIHAVHHLYPRMPWYEIPAFFRANRDRVLGHNGGYYFRGYAVVARRRLFRPVFTPAHPR